MDITCKQIPTSDLARLDIVCLSLGLGPFMGVVKKIEPNDGGGVNLDFYYGARIGWYAPQITVVDTYEPNR